jgi:hypothetical protein
MKKIKTRKRLQKYVDTNGKEQRDTPITDTEIRQDKYEGQRGGTGVGSPTGINGTTGSVRVGSLIKNKNNENSSRNNNSKNRQ